MWEINTKIHLNFSVPIPFDIVGMLSHEAKLADSFIDDVHRFDEIFAFLSVYQSDFVLHSSKKEENWLVPTCDMSITGILT